MEHLLLNTRKVRFQACIGPPQDLYYMDVLPGRF
jgi:hypothetical protein